ncbi:MAG: hypothetical protein V4813_08775 [Gemmatimonadota bacterium]
MTAPAAQPQSVVEPTTHPLERLIELWTAARTQGEVLGKTLPMRRIWAAVFDIDIDGDVSPLYPYLTSLVQLVAEVRHEIETAPGIARVLVLEAFSPIESVVRSGRIDATFESVAHAFKQDVFAALTLTSATLAHYHPRTAVSLDDRDRLASELDALAASITLMTDISADVRAALLTCIEAMRHAIRRYRIAGPQAFHDAFKTCLGEIDYQISADPTATAAIEKSGIVAALAKVKKYGGYALKLLGVQKQLKDAGVDLPAMAKHLLESGAK